jgi:putative membrane protein (TIGR04086 family)
MFSSMLRHSDVYLSSKWNKMEQTFQTETFLMNSSGISAPKLLLRCLLLAYLLSGLMILGLAFVLFKLKLPEAQIDMAVFAIYSLVCLISGMAAGKAAESRRFFWGLLIGILYFVVLFAASFVLGRGSLPDMSRSATALACCAIGGMVGGMMS